MKFTNKKRFNKFRTQKSYGDQGEKFVYMQALVFFQCLSNLVLAWVARRQTATLVVDNVPAYMYSACSVSYFMAMLFSNMALEWVNYPTQVFFLFKMGGK